MLDFYVIGAAVAAALLVYLFIALLTPERLS
jgi:K+-transporting ATPase KdpF subunit